MNRQKIDMSHNKRWYVRLWNYFNLYEKIWFASIVAFALVIAIVLPEADVNEVKGTGLILTTLFFFQVTIGLMCELLNSKQNRWGCFIYIFVEIITIVIEIIASDFRFASIATALCFWIPIHLITFINWYRHIDKDDKTKTVVRRLKLWQSLILLIVGVIATFGIGYLITDFVPELTLTQKIICYLDASLGVLGIFDGILLLFRFEEAWYIWYIYIIAEVVLNILDGRWVALVYDLGYFTNTTYGLILWKQYIKASLNSGSNNNNSNTQQDVVVEEQIIKQ